ncbi:DNA cytosine methyltransferase [Rhodovulum tesquicola]|uniref:DNA cytosine methyltransferase n=1 Tax=Rhodovulum tesquicola TaxID=540254 RepID=UPI002096C29D|nr:DNA cytosine methyltransferase [Rhodovulum tesquicola]MCO8144842.1 DNA cytosine methyltransferase [Rhodovulum tesquicola]
MNVNVAADCHTSEADVARSEWWQGFLRGSHKWDDPARPPLQVIDLFCGSGGFGLGAALAASCFGQRAVFQAIADADAPAMDVYARSLPVRSKISESLATIVDYSVDRVGPDPVFDYPPELLHSALAAEVGSTDLLIAGPPCQGHSNLNNHTRRNDPRNDLFVATAAIVVALGARAVVIENVPGVLRSHSDVVDLARRLLLSEGYAVADRVLRMDELGGWQTRARYFMVAILDGAQEELESILNGVSGRKTDMILAKQAPQDVLWAIGDLVDNAGNSTFETSPVQGPENARRIDFLFDEDLHDLPNSERPDCHRDGTTYTSVYGRMHADKPAPTITTGIGTPGQGRFIHPSRRRLITPHEAARIQCFPDGYGFCTVDEEQPRKALAKWIGDAVPPYLGMSVVCAALTAVTGKQPTYPWENEIG